MDLIARLGRNLRLRLLLRQLQVFLEVRPLGASSA